MFMDLAILLVLAIVVIAVAYALGTYVRRRGDMPGSLGPLRSPLVQRLLGRSDERDTQAVISWLLSQAFEQTGVKVADDKIAYQRIVEAAQKAVQDLKTQDTVTISLPFLTADVSGPKHFEIRLTKEVIQELARY